MQNTTQRSKMNLTIMLRTCEYGIITSTGLEAAAVLRKSHCCRALKRAACFGIGDVASNIDVGASKQVSPSEALPDSALQQIKLLQGFNGEKLHRRLFGNGREDLAGGREEG
ncbi:unnamed protein product [Miscanthus lutarioriparius]|uniref:Uncharacterized protein n=1 Tax=Miscanthus lutarioriparius TaxID=422564 RepID=A0A811QFC3_9POAL|nr:unnamed protein product [Miscanthus lutarioriparius]